MELTDYDVFRKQNGEREEYRARKLFESKYKKTVLYSGREKKPI